MNCPDLKMAAMFTFGAINWIPRWYHPDGDLTVDDLADRLTAFVIQTIGVPARDGA